MLLEDSEQKAIWLFADSEELKKEKLMLKLKEASEMDTKSGKKVPVLIFEGQPNDIRLSMWKVKGIDEIKKVLGKDTIAWNNKYFHVYVVNKQLHLDLAEEVVK